MDALSTEEMTPKMDAELKAKWITALRSGEYEQGTCSLFTDGKYCCMGVLGVLKGIPLEKLTDDSSGVTPAEWGDVPHKAVDRLIYMNDTARNTFQEIADYIEKNL